MRGLQRKVVIVTGAASGIGLATTGRLLDEATDRARVHATACTLGQKAADRRAAPRARPTETRRCRTAKGGARAIV